MLPQIKQNQRKQIINRMPMGRLGTADAVIPLALFLLSKCEAFSSGNNIIDGGISS